MSDTPTASALAPFTLPLRREGDAAIVDATGETVLVADPDRHLENDEDAARLADLVFAMLTAAHVREEGGAVDDLERLLAAAITAELQDGGANVPYGVIAERVAACVADSYPAPSCDLTMAAEKALAFLRNAPLESGICCCGDPIVGHGYGSGHSPVDDLAYHSSQVAEKLAAALATREEAPAEAGERIVGTIAHVSNGRSELPELIASALRAQPQAREEAGPAEPEVGRAIYERIEKLMAGDPNGWERAYLSHLVASVEEVGGYDGPQAREEAQPVAYEIVSYDIYPGSVWIPVNEADEYRAKYGCVLRPLYTTPPAPEAENLRVAVEALEPFAAVMADIGESEDDADCFRNPSRDHAKSQGISVGHIRMAAKALAALQQEGR